jgi:hypothetical protein
VCSHNVFLLTVNKIIKKTVAYNRKFEALAAVFRDRKNLKYSRLVNSDVSECRATSIFRLSIIGLLLA